MRIRTPENTNTNSLTITVNDTASDLTAHHDDVLQRPHGQSRLHSGADQVSDDLVSEHVLDRAKLELFLRCSIFGDVNELKLVRTLGGELVPVPLVLVGHGAQIILDR